MEHYIELYINTFNDLSIFTMISLITGFIWYYGNPVDILTHPFSTFMDGAIGAFITNLCANLVRAFFCPDEFVFVLSTFLLLSGCFCFALSFFKETKMIRFSRTLKDPGLQLVA